MKLDRLTKKFEIPEHIIEDILSRNKEVSSHFKKVKKERDPSKSESETSSSSSNESDYTSPGNSSVKKGSPTKGGARSPTSPKKLGAKSPLRRMITGSPNVSK